MYFESERLIFREWEDKDKEVYINLNQHPQVMKYFYHIPTAEEAIGEMWYYNDKIEQLGYGFWAVENKKTGEVIGDMGVQQTPFQEFFTPSLEIGWRLFPKFWGQSLATEGATRILEYVKEKNIAKEIIAYTANLNMPSQKLMRKIGMQYIGEFNNPLIDKSSPLYPHVIYKI